MLARQVLGGTTADQVTYAKQAMDLSLDKLQQRTRLISQEKSGSFTSTGAGDYTWTAAPINQNKVFRVVKVYTNDRDLDMPSHELFISQHPDYRNDRSGLPQYAVQWGENNLLIWPDTAGDVIYFTFHELLSTGNTNRVLSVLYDLGRHYLESKPETRALNWQIAQESAKDANRANDRTAGTPLVFLPEERVVNMNMWKRRRR